MNSSNICKNKNIKQKNSKVEFDNLKSDYFLKRIFEYMKKNKSLEIIKYNKKLQKRVNIGIKDYIEFAQFYSSIEVELTIEENKYGKFINISDEDKDYCHIYFDNSKEEIKRYYLEDKDKVKKITIIIDYQVKSFKRIFLLCSCISSIFFKKFYRIDITDMSFMFFGCFSLKELNLSNFRTDNVTNMHAMFGKCYCLNELNLSNFNTNNVTNMKGMFSKCENLKKLNISNFNINNVTEIFGIFFECFKLKEIIVYNFKTHDEEKINKMLIGISDELKEKLKCKILI